MTDKDKEKIYDELARIDEFQQDVYRDKATIIAWGAGRFFATTEIRLYLNSMQASEVSSNVTSKVSPKPKFKVGYKVQYFHSCGTIMTIEKIENGKYIFANDMGCTSIEDGNNWELVEGEVPVSKVWHDAKEEQPNPKKITLGMFKDRTCPVVGYNSWYDENSIWAYLDDLLNLTHSVTKISDQDHVSDDLEKAAENYANKKSILLGFDSDAEPIQTGTDIKKAVIYGAQWQKQQMMMDAIDATVESDLDGHGADYGIQKLNCEFMQLESKHIKTGKKVKLLILKED